MAPLVKYQDEVAVVRRDPIDEEQLAQLAQNKANWGGQLELLEGENVRLGHHVASVSLGRPNQKDAALVPGVVRCQAAAAAILQLFNRHFHEPEIEDVCLSH